MAASNLDTAYWKRIDALLELALGLPPRERARWLDTLGPQDEPHKPLLKALLARSDAERDGFMERPVGASLLNEAAEDVHADKQGDIVGPYRLNGLLGSGGMGSVWAAERADGTLRRRIALKLPRGGWMPGLAERLKRECEVLSTLEHPNIARLYDAGLTPAGRPYLAMELIDGVPIDEYCGSRRLGTRERVMLFLQVADAIAYAHARLVVHRDLKPANILVDATGMAHVVDFGVARVLADGAPPAGEVTQLAGRALTPDYASPEQIRNQPVTVASDVYSLGVVLYELLSGSRPYRVRRDSPAALEEAILEADILPCSARATGASARELRGDLDTILGKALRKEPIDRYPSVHEFAEDLRRHLEGRPVRARPPTLRYALGKFARRNRMLTTAVLAVALAMVAGLAGTLHQARIAQEEARKATVERDLAVRELQFSEANEDFLRFMLSEQSGRPLTTAQLLRRAEKAVVEQYAGDSMTRARIQLVLADLLGEEQEYERAESMLAQARASAEAAGDAALGDEILCTLAGLLGATGRGEEALSMFEMLLARIDRTSEAGTRALRRCLTNRALVHRNGGRAAESIADSEAALALFDPERPGHLTSRIFLKNEIANALTLKGEQAAALAMHEQAAAELARIGRANTSAGLIMANNLIFHLNRAGQVRRAADVYARLGEADDDLPATSTLDIGYARVLTAQGREREAAELAEAALARKARLGDHRGEAFGYLAAAEAWCAQGDALRCEAMLAQAESRLKKMVPPDSSVHGTFALHRGRVALHNGPLQTAREHLETAVGLFRAARDRNPLLVRALSLLATARQLSGDTVGAAKAAADAVETARALTQGLSHSEWVGTALFAKAMVVAQQGDTAAALDAAREAREHLSAAVGADSAPALRATALLWVLETMPATPRNRPS